MARYTPGPWTPCFHLRSAENDASCPCGYRGGVWSDEEIICEMGGSPELDGNKMLPEPDRETARANAWLIAAAPDLLEALEYLCKGTKDEDIGAIAHGFIAARAAIVKAKGGA